MLDRLTRDTPDIVQSIAGDVADALRAATPAVQPLMAEARDVDVFLVALVDQVVDRELAPTMRGAPTSRPGAGCSTSWLGTAWPACARRSRRGLRGR